MSARAYRRLIVFIVLLAAQQALAWMPAMQASPSSEAFGVTIHVEGDGWGNAGHDEIEAVLYAVADQLVTHPAAVFDQPIVVTHAQGSPVTLYQRGPRGEYLVRLSSRDRRWAQYAYQFGHELCHIMSNYAAHDAKRVVKRNQWFEEALCETAALYVLRSMADAWQRDAPSASWEDYAPVLRTYAERLIAEPHRHLPAGFGPSRWLNANLDRLARDPYQRHYNEVVATLLLPLFEQAPEHWAALHALNRDPLDPVAALPRFLQNWEQNAAPEHRDFIATLAERLELDELAARSSSARGDDSANTPSTPGPLQAGRVGPLAR